MGAKIEKIVIFYLHLKPDEEGDYYRNLKKTINDDGENEILTDFPINWRLWKSDNQRKDVLFFDEVAQAQEWLKLHIRPQFLYKIASWTIEEDYKIFSNVPQLIEVSEV